VSKPRKSKTGDYQDGVKVVEAFKEFRTDLAREQTRGGREGKPPSSELLVYGRRRCRDFLLFMWANKES